MELNLNGKVALITGAGSGMGLLCAQCYAKEGAKVVLADLNEDAVKSAADEINANGGEAIAVKVDVTNYEQIVACRDKAVEAFGAIDILVTCAGGAETRLLGLPWMPYHEIPISAIDFGIDLNLKGAMYFQHAVFAQMAKQYSGVMISLGSITGEEGGTMAYAAAKSALMKGVVKTLAQYGAEYNIRSVCVAPGPVLTRPGMANMKTMAGRAADPQEIVDMILYVSSDRGAFINGTTILIDGGRNVLMNKTGPQPEKKTAPKND